MADAIRPHFTYATVDMPSEARSRLGIADEVAEEVRAVMLREGIEAAGRLVPPAVVERSALVGSSEAVGERLANLRAAAAPDLFLLPLNEHNAAEEFIEQAAGLLDAAGFRRLRKGP
jgi:alkanesulfonate monooxygenase SsuD/methylene tetrahydromethanopterin reductase-like flavin-dependent oxidoreductase (luciferase family)